MRTRARMMMIVAGGGAVLAISGCSEEAPRSGSARYVTERAFHENMEKQTSMAPRTLEQLRQYGVAEDALLKLEFFFYTTNRDKAESLSQALKQLGYDPTVGVSQHDKRTFVITGWTTPMRMDTQTVVAWTRQMVELGYEHDAEFDGWGTSPEQ